MSAHDAAHDYQRRLVALIDSSPNKRAACRQVGIHHSTYYRWRNRSTAPTPRPRRRGWKAQRLDAQVVAMALSHYTLGPQQIADQLRDHGIEVSASTVWRILRHHRLNTRRLRHAVMGRGGGPVVVNRPIEANGPGELHAEVPGDLVQMDCFYVGTLKETRLGQGKRQRGKVWQYTATDVASSFLWAELHASPHNPTPTNTSALAYRVAKDLKRWGWRLKAISTDNGNEFRSAVFRDALSKLEVEHRFIRAGRPQSNGKVERVQGTLLEEFYKPVLPQYVEPSISGLRRDLEDYIHYFNWQRRHRGKWNRGRTPAEIIEPKEAIIP